MDARRSIRVTNRINQLRLTVVGCHSYGKGRISIVHHRIFFIARTLNNLTLCLVDLKCSGILRGCGIIQLSIIFCSHRIVRAIGFQGKRIRSGIRSLLSRSNHDQGCRDRVFIIASYQREAICDSKIIRGNLRQLLAVSYAHVLILHVDRNRTFLNGRNNLHDHILVLIGILRGKCHLTGLCRTYL